MASRIQWLFRALSWKKRPADFSTKDLDNATIFRSSLMKVDPAKLFRPPKELLFHTNRLWLRVEHSTTQIVS